MAACAALGLGTLYAYQRPFRVYKSLEPYDVVNLPEDYAEKTEWVFGRLMFPSHPYAKFERYFSDWREGGTGWSEDYPRADRHFNTALKRLTRINVRSVEQPVNPDDGDDIYNWPFLYVGLPGNWNYTEEQSAKIREFLNRGGFLVADDFWQADEWAGFEQGMQRIFPDRPIVDIEEEDPLFHTVYDLGDRYQIPGEWATRPGMSYRSAGTTAYWRAVYDDKGRAMVAICANSDLGDAWEWADAPHYPEKYSALGIRIGVNYVLYALTH